MTALLVSAALLLQLWAPLLHTPGGLIWRAGGLLTQPARPPAPVACGWRLVSCRAVPFPAQAACQLELAAKGVGRLRCPAIARSIFRALLAHTCNLERTPPQMTSLHAAASLTAPDEAHGAPWRPSDS